MNHFYEQIEGWFDFEDLYREAVRRTPFGGVMIEVGVYQGRSLAFLAVEALNAQKDLQVIGLDRFNWPHDAAARVWAFRQQFGLSNLSLHSADSVRGAATYQDASLDFVFLDADHTYESVLADLRAWFPKIKKGGVLAGHDLGHPEYPGVRMAVEQCFLDPRTTLDPECRYREIAPSSDNPGVSSFWVDIP